MKRGILIALLVPMAFLGIQALGQLAGETHAGSDEEAAAAHAGSAEAEEGGHDAHHGGPLTLEHILHDPNLWVAALNFTLLALLLVRFGKAPIHDFLVGRRQQMEQAINEAAEAKRTAELKLAEYDARLAQLDGELTKLRADLIAGGEEDKRRTVEEAEEVARRTKRETEALVDQYAKQLQTDVRHQIVEAAIVAAETLVREKLAPADQQRLADVYKERVAGYAAGAANRAPKGGGLPS